MSKKIKREFNLGYRSRFIFDNDTSMVTVPIYDDDVRHWMNEKFVDGLVAGKIIYWCDEHQGYHLRDDFGLENSLSVVMACIESNDFSAYLDPKPIAALTPETMLDIRSADMVEFEFEHGNNAAIWLNIDGVCRVRVQDARSIFITDPNGQQEVNVWHSYSNDLNESLGGADALGPEEEWANHTKPALTEEEESALAREDQDRDAAVGYEDLHATHQVQEMEESETEIKEK